MPKKYCFKCQQEIIISELSLTSPTNNPCCADCQEQERQKLLRKNKVQVRTDYADPSEEKIWQKLSQSGLSVSLTNELVLSRFAIKNKQELAQQLLSEIQHSAVKDEKLKRYVALWEDFLTVYLTLSEQIEQLNYEKKLLKEESFWNNKVKELENELQHQQESNQQALTSLQSTLTLKEEELKKTREETTTSTASLRTEIKELTEQLENAKKETTRLLLLEKQLSEIQQLLSESQVNLTEKETNLAELTLANQSLLEKITALESELTSQEELISNLEKTKLEITQKLTDLQTNLTDKSLSLEEAHEEISQLQLNLLYQQQLSHKFTKEKTELNNSLTFLEEQLISLQQSTSEQLALVKQEKLLSEQNFTNLLSEKYDLVNQIKQLASDLSKISHEKEKAVNDYKISQQTIINLKSELTTLRSEKRNLVNDLKVKNNEITNLQQNISELEAIITKLENSLDDKKVSDGDLPSEKDNWLTENWKSLTILGTLLISSYYLLKE